MLKCKIYRIKNVVAIEILEQDYEDIPRGSPESYFKTISLPCGTRVSSGKGPSLAILEIDGALKEVAFGLRGTNTKLDHNVIAVTCSTRDIAEKVESVLKNIIKTINVHFESRKETTKYEDVIVNTCCY